MAQVLFTDDTPIPLVHQDPITEPTLTEEALAHYFMSMDVPRATVSPLDTDLTKVETALAGDIPRASLFRLADSAEVLDVKKNSFRPIGLQLGTLSSLYARAKFTEGNAQTSQQDLANLQDEKDGYMASFLSLDQE